MKPLAIKAFLLMSAAALLVGPAVAQPNGSESTYPAPTVSTPRTAYSQSLSQTDATYVASAFQALKRGDVSGARGAMSSVGDPLARKLILWGLADQAGNTLSFFEADNARRDLAGWPREARRQAAAERKLETGSLGPSQVIAWFGGAEPQTAEGAMALASALQASGKGAEATALVRKFWREKVFEADVQSRMLARFGGILTADDHTRRADILLYGSQGPAARQMVDMLPADHRALAEARMRYRANAANANDVAALVPSHLANHPGLVFEKAAYLKRRGLDGLALAQLQSFPTEAPTSEAGERIWDLRYQLVLAALKAQDYRGAYAAAANSGLTSGVDAADAEFYAGWLALQRLKDPAKADKHFANLERIGTSPITQGRALYWRGRAMEAAGDRVAAMEMYGRAARHNTTFYGQLAAERVGDGKLHLGKDPEITAADRARFERRETVRAARYLHQAGLKDTFKAFIMAVDDTIPTAQEAALLADLARMLDTQDLSMKVARTAAQRGFILPERGWPVRTPPSVDGAPEQALVLGITRQESGFDPMVRSSADARGMMQLLPSTAQLTARRIGVSYSAAQLWEPDYNMRLGSAYLGQVIGQFSGSYVMGIASYNAGPGRPAQWSAFCGDPRTASVDPIDFIECIPFSETRNYVMRVMEGMQVYRARLNGGSAPITLSSDLKRGGYNYPRPSLASAAP